MPADESNPYAPPAAASAGEPANPLAFGELVRAWEKLRLIYNALLILPGIGVVVLWVARTDLSLPVALILSVPVALGANAAFFLGPMAELYFRAMFRAGAPIGRGRWLIFGAGLVVAAGVFLTAALLAIAYGDQ